MNDVAVYDTAFNSNEIVVLVLIVIFHFLLFRLPKRFPPLVVLIMYLFSFTSGVLFDNTIGTHIFDFYDVSDNSLYTFMDILSYVMYGPLGYLLVYTQDRFQLKGKRLVTFLMVWALLSVPFEWFLTYLGVFHYKNGYHIYYSMMVYVFMSSATYWFYRFIAYGRVVEESSLP